MCTYTLSAVHITKVLMLAETPPRIRIKALWAYCRFISGRLPGSDAPQVPAVLTFSLPSALTAAAINPTSFIAIPHPHPHPAEWAEISARLLMHDC